MKSDLRKITEVISGRAVRMLCLVFLVVFVTGCVTTQDTNMMQREINTLRSEVKSIKQKSKNIETRFPGQQKQFDERAGEIEETQAAAAKMVSDLLIRVQYLTTEVQMLTGRFEEARYHSEKNSAELKESKEMLFAKMKQLEVMVEDLKKRLSEPAPVAAPKEEPKKRAASVKGKEAEKEQGKESRGAVEHKDNDKAVDDKERKKEDGPEAAKDDDTEEDAAVVKDVYMAAYEAYKEDRTVEAREKFKALLMDYSENEYSDNARFWIAESYYKDGNYEDAILAYEELFKKNPGSDKEPGAMLKQGLAFYALKDRKTGKIILEKLIDKYPDSDQARLAHRKINKTVPPKKQ